MCHIDVCVCVCVTRDSQRVGCGQHRAARVERGLDACLGNCDCLLLHHLVDRHTVLVTHLVELVNANHT